MKTTTHTTEQTMTTKQQMARDLQAAFNDANPQAMVRAAMAVRRAGYNVRGMVGFCSWALCLSYGETLAQLNVARENVLDAAARAPRVQVAA